jgi:CelD/BcsL family acetyltransferase involved in cellulose biosynthesis
MAGNDIVQLLRAGKNVMSSAVIDEIKQEMAVKYEILTDIDDVRSIASEWDELLRTSRCNLAFNCSKWYLARIELQPTDQPLEPADPPLVFTAYRGQVLSGVLPLWLYSAERLAHFGGDYRDYTDIIAADDDREVITGLLKFALQGAGNYDRLVLGTVKRDSNFVTAAKALGLGGAICEFFAPDKALAYGVIDLMGGYDEYMKMLSTKFRLNLNRMRNKAGRDGLVVRELKPADFDPHLLPETFLSLHLSRFGDCSDFKSAEAWIRQLFPALFMEQRIRVFALLRNERILGIYLVAVARAEMNSYSGGFLPEVQQYHPGKLLIHHAIRQAFLEGLAEFDLGCMHQDYKGDWKPARREVGELQFATDLK